MKPSCSARHSFIPACCVAMAVKGTRRGARPAGRPVALR
jgi:hypothetical protein